MTSKFDMWALRNFQRHCLKAMVLLQNRNFLFGDTSLQRQSNNVIKSKLPSEMHSPSVPMMSWVSGSRLMSTTKGRSMRSKVEKRIRRETGKTLREIRRAKKLRKKLMTEEERLIYNMRRAKKKVALLLQKLKKYELPELPAPRHDPELLTTEQLQAYKKIGFRNRNYVPVGVRGVFGGVVQNMHLHWKFHETVQVCCDNFPKEKIKEMATMLAILSGGIVVNIHNVKTIIMFRGRNYRQPKNLIPINTLTKRKALFKARFEQALESQKLNIKKIEQQLRRKGINPEDPVAMASIQRVASTFFRAIDERQGTPYVFHGDNQQTSRTNDMPDDVPDLPSEDSDQEELDRFIAEIEDAADQEWAEEEAAEKEESTRIRYWGKDDMGMRGRSPRSSADSEDVDGNHGRGWNGVSSRQRTTDLRKWDSDDEISDASEGEEWDSNDVVSDRVANTDSDTEKEDETHRRPVSRSQKNSRVGREEALTRRGGISLRGRSSKVDSESDGDMFGDPEEGLLETDDDEEHGSPAFRGNIHDHQRGSYEDGNSNCRNNTGMDKSKKRIDESWDSE